MLTSRYDFLIRQIMFFASCSRGVVSDSGEMKGIKTAIHHAIVGDIVSKKGSDPAQEIGLNHLSL